jgi:hypothetical protein
VGEERGFLSSGCSAVTSAAVAIRTCAAVWTYALAVVDGLATPVTTWHVCFFVHHNSLTLYLISHACRLRFRKSVYYIPLSVVLEKMSNYDIKNETFVMAEAGEAEAAGANLCLLFFAIS